MTDHERSRPAGNGAAPTESTAADTPKANEPSGQILPIGPHLSVETLYVGSLLWPPLYWADTLGLFARVRPDYLEDLPLREIYRAVRTLARTRNATFPYSGPQLVQAELIRTGDLNERIAGRLREATTSGASAELSHEYGAAVVANAYRRHLESLGHALTVAATAMSEPELTQLVSNGVARATEIEEHLSFFRSEAG